MKNQITILVVFLFGLLNIAATNYDPPIPPAPQNGNAVVDGLGWLNADQINSINRINAALDQEGLAQLAVVTTNDCGNDKPRYRYDVFNTWGIGHRNKDDGLLIMVCWYNGDKSLRTVSQEVGYGMEETIPDLLTKRMVDQVFKPYFTANKPGEGLLMMVVAYDKIIRKTATHDEAIKEVLQPLGGGVVPEVNGATPQGHPEEKIRWLVDLKFLGLECIYWLIIGFVALVMLALWADKKGYIDLSEILASVPTANTDNNKKEDTNTYTGGESGNGGSDIGF